MYSLLQGDLCDICVTVRWGSPLPEDTVGHPHHRSRQALEASARTCPLCKMILRAAISNYRDSRGTRHGKGYWRQQDMMKVKDIDGIQDIKTQIKDLGACMPLMPPTLNRFSVIYLRQTENAANNEHVRHPGLIIEDEESIDTVLRQGTTVLFPTGAVDVGGNCLATEPSSHDEEVRIKSLTASMPVWVYGNWWCIGKAKGGNAKGKLDLSHLRLVGIGARFGYSSSHLDAVNATPAQSHLRGSSIRVYTNDDSALKHIPGRLRERESDSDTAFDRLVKWLKDCTSNHDERCNDSRLAPFLPTRVLDVLASDYSVSLVETKGQREKYISLSHCWGKSSRLMATKSTLQDLKSGIAMDALPKTFQDAITITRKLRIRYLWIDCLCIIQDDPLDWEREASKMGQVYRQSYLTISAASSMDSHTGCFPSRQSYAHASPWAKSLGYDTSTDTASETLTLASPSSSDGQTFLHLSEEWLPGSSYYMPQHMSIRALGKPLDPLADQPLSKRGWTLQERLLSQRIIHYAQDQMYFECESCLTAEDTSWSSDPHFSMNRLLETQRLQFEHHGRRPIEGNSIIAGYNPAPIHGVRWNGGWLSLVEDYSRRALTKPEDKLPAISGVARTIAEETDDQYFAGLWANHIYEDLYWRVTSDREHKESGDTQCETLKDPEVMSRPNFYRAPSWSWASIDAPIRFIPLNHEDLVAQVLNCSTTSAGPDRFGKVSAGFLALQAPIFEIKHHQPKELRNDGSTLISIDMGDERGMVRGAFYPDLPNNPLQLPSYAVFLDSANALVIRTTTSEPCFDRNTTVNLSRLRPRAIPTSPEIREDFETKAIEKGSHCVVMDFTIRVGTAEFVTKDEKELQSGPVVLNADISRWGPVTSRDAKASVTIL